MPSFRLCSLNGCLWAASVTRLAANSGHSRAGSDIGRHDARPSLISKAALPIPRAVRTAVPGQAGTAVRCGLSSV
jgi:hypothetical protein